MDERKKISHVHCHCYRRRRLSVHWNLLLVRRQDLHSPTPTICLPHKALHRIDSFDKGKQSEQGITERNHKASNASAQRIEETTRCDA
ncbi:hypothetical protein Ae201684_004799 [Aphanomyces euteiches]|uniref:Uncharacterized protein n=1 Tax=Aphanomyces euteiches TaxID=100861 RepID=A0A6G0XH34_9STRA|nr:hypothetical protein Ae201684_004799 [Aphanomyces euteiches]